MQPKCNRQGCDNTAHPDDTNVLVQLSLTEEHKFWCSAECFRKDENQ